MRNLHKKKVNVLGKQIPVLLIAMVVVMGVGTAALLPYFGQITGQVTADQGLYVDGNAWDEKVIVDNLGPVYSNVGGSSVSAHVLTNDADNDTEATLDRTGCSFDGTVASGDDADRGSCDEITTKYYKSGVYQETVQTNTSKYSIPADITIEDMGDTVKWTIDMDESDADFANGHGAYGLVISANGINPDFQVHSNDGTCTSVWDAGTHLYSEYYNDSWHTGGSECGTTNTEVSTMDSINASGDRDLASNADLVYEVEISKELLGDKEFYWGIALMGDTSDTQYPETWDKWSGDASGLATASLLQEITDSVTVPANGEVSFAVVNEFPVGTYPGTYDITTEVSVLGLNE